MKNLFSSQELRARREALGVSQPKVVDMVKKLTGGKFSQQALSKFEENPQAMSKYAAYIDQALHIFETHGPDVKHEDLIFKVSLPDVGTRFEDWLAKSGAPAHQLAALLSAADESEIIDILCQFAPRLPREHRVRLAAAALRDIEDDEKEP